MFLPQVIDVSVFLSLHMSGLDLRVQELFLSLFY